MGKIRTYHPDRVVERRIRALLRSIVLGAVVIALGSVGYMLLEGWSFLESLFMTVITLATVGYQTVHPLSEAGTVFTILLIVSGVGVAAYGFTALSQCIIEGELKTVREIRYMQKQIASLSGHNIICGYGRLARIVLAQLRDSKEKSVVIENSNDIVRELIEQGTLCVEGSAYSDESLLAAGISRAKVLLALLPKDADNVYVTLCAKALNPKIKIIARSEDQTAEDKLRRAGADVVISPYGICGSRIAQQLLRPFVSDFLQITESKDGVSLALEEILIPENSPIGGKTLEEAGLRQKTGVIIAALIDRNGKMQLNPVAQNTLECGSTMIVVGDRASLNKLNELL